MRLVERRWFLLSLVADGVALLFNAGLTTRYLLEGQWAAAGFQSLAVAAIASFVWILVAFNARTVAMLDAALASQRLGDAMRRKVEAGDVDVEGVVEVRH